jgi:TolB-like protein/AraC-like DNA-binding protein/tetratricopeptide (TPR) repeat protein
MEAHGAQPISASGLFIRKQPNYDDAEEGRLSFKPGLRMTATKDRFDLPRPPRGGPIPRDVAKTIAFLRGRIGRKITMSDLVEHCGVAERTLSKHFRTFLGVSPLRYLQRLRLQAVRDAMLRHEQGCSIAEIASRYGFTHFGRFSAQYFRSFGESPSATHRRGRIALRAEEEVRYDRVGTTPGIGIGQSHLVPRLRDAPSIAVLPCEVSDGAPADRWFAETLAEGLAAALCSIRSLCVAIAHMPPAGSRESPSRRELGARYILHGRMARAGTKLRIILRLVDATTDNHVWGDSFDGDTDCRLELQDRVIQGALGAILPSIRGSEMDRVRRTPPADLDAYGFAMRALPLVFDATVQALELLERSLEIDPDYGLATGLAGWCRGQLVMNNATKVPDAEKRCALRLAARAAILDSDDPLVLTARCAVHTMAGEFDVADALLSRALALDPTSAWAWGRSGWLNSYRGNCKAAIEHFGRAISLDPRSSSKANSCVGMGSAHFGAGRYDQAAFWMRKALLQQPSTLWANRTLSVSYARLGEPRKATESLLALRRYCPDLTVSQVTAAIPFQPGYLARLGEGLNALGLPP